MQSFWLSTDQNIRLRFELYQKEAPQTCQAFLASLPFQRTFLHARVSGQEIWIDDAPALSVPQENASVFPSPGEIVIGPALPLRNRIRQCIGIFYGPGQLFDCGNIFGRAWEEDLPLLQQLGDAIWRYGGQELSFYYEWD